MKYMQYFIYSILNNLNIIMSVNSEPHSTTCQCYSSLLQRRTQGERLEMRMRIWCLDLKCPLDFQAASCSPLHHVIGWCHFIGSWLCIIDRNSRIFL